jgi:hypothetical protein
MAAPLFGDYPVFTTGPHSYYLGMYNEILTVARINTHTREITDTYSFHYSRGLVPIAGAKQYSERTRVARQVNQLLLFYSNIPFFDHHGFHYFANTDEDVVYIHVKSEPMFQDVAIFREMKQSQEWEVVEWNPSTDKEANNLIASSTKAKDAFYDYYKYC